MANRQTNKQTRNKQTNKKQTNKQTNKYTINKTDWLTGCIIRQLIHWLNNKQTNKQTNYLANSEEHSAYLQATNYLVIQKIPRNLNF